MSMLRVLRTQTRTRVTSTWCSVRFLSTVGLVSSSTPTALGMAYAFTQVNDFAWNAHVIEIAYNRERESSCRNEHCLSALEEQGWHTSRRVCCKGRWILTTGRRGGVRLRVNSRARPWLSRRYTN